MSEFKAGEVCELVYIRQKADPSWFPGASVVVVAAQTKDPAGCPCDYKVKTLADEYPGYVFRDQLRKRRQPESYKDQFKPCTKDFNWREPVKGEVVA